MTFLLLYILLKRHCYEESKIESKDINNFG